MPGEIHALLGENGAGKSTLVKIVYGVLKADAGQILWHGKPVAIGSPAQARRLGIGMVFQNFSLFDSLTVAENIALGIDDKVPMRELTERIGEVSVRYGLALDPSRHVHTLSVGERQRVEIVRCLLQNPALRRLGKKAIEEAVKRGPIARGGQTKAPVISLKDDVARRADQGGGGLRHGAPLR